MTQQLALTDQQEFLHSSSRQPYQKIGNEIREKVIYDIVFQEQSIKQTAIKYGLKYSTANGIVQTYQQQGRCSKKDKRNKKQYYKRNKILVMINIQTGNAEFYLSQSNSSVLILEQSNDLQITSNFNKHDQFKSQKECTGQFVYSDLESISKNIFIEIRKLEKSICQKNNLISIGQSTQSPILEISKTEDQALPEQFPERKIENQEDVERNQQCNLFKRNDVIIQNSKENETTNIIKLEALDNFSIQFLQNNNNNHFNYLDNGQERNFQNILQLWRQQIQLMHKA